MNRATLILLGSMLLFGQGVLDARPEPDSLRDEAAQALKKAVTFYRTKVASRGGYLYYYSTDLKDRWGEGKFDENTIFVQPPGTPTVGLAYLKAYAATGDPAYLEAGKAAAEALVAGQLESGGWTQTIHFAPAKRMGKYRKGNGGGWNVSSLDDGQTQAALQLLIRADQALGFKHAGIHEASLYGLEALLKVQYPCGAFPQGWRAPGEAHPALKAKFPDYDWKTEGKVKDYFSMYTINDNIPGTVLETLIEAHAAYKDEKYKAAIEKLGNFLILAQMPEPQPGWCQQYNFQMVPIWARKFEPSAITGWESQDAMETLIKVFRATGNKKYLEPLPSALAYYKKCVLPDGRIARFYEFQTNKPLYMDKSYQLTYDDSAAPSHYGWKQSQRFDDIEKAYLEAKNGSGASGKARSAADLEAEVRKIVASLDAEGRWITTHDGERLVGQPKFQVGYTYLNSAVFSRNVETLSEYLAATKK